MEIVSSEIVVGTIGDGKFTFVCYRPFFIAVFVDSVTQAIEWMRLTFFYRRIQSNPAHYHLPSNLSPEQLTSKVCTSCALCCDSPASSSSFLRQLRQVCLGVVNRLVEADFVQFVDPEGRIFLLASSCVSRVGFARMSFCCPQR